MNSPNYVTKMGSPRRSVRQVVSWMLVTSMAAVIGSANAAKPEKPVTYRLVDGLPAMDQPKHTVKLDPALPSYVKPRGELRGVLASHGSETFGGAMKELRDAFIKFHPNVRVVHERAEWAVGALMLGDGASQLLPVVRELTDKEMEPYIQKFHRQPFGIKMSKTMWDEPARTHPYGIFVHKDNPMRGITVEQAAWAFFKHYPGSSPTSQPLTKWGQLGLEGEWQDRYLHVYGDVKEHALTDNFKYIMSQLVGFKLQLREGDPQVGMGYVGQIDEDYVAMICKNDIHAICWTGVPIGKEHGLKLLEMPRLDGKGWSSCSLQDYVDGVWPLTRHTYMYVNKEPGKAIDPVVQEFLRFILSREGQRAILDDGYLPLTAAEAKVELARTK